MLVIEVVIEFGILRIWDFLVFFRSVWEFLGVFRDMCAVYVQFVFALL